MAARSRKKAPKTNAVAKRKSTVITKFDPSAHDLGGEVDRERTDMGAEGNYISTRGGVFRIGDEQYGELDGFILDHVLVNTYYEGDWDADNPRGATCFAIGRDQLQLAPPSELATSCAESCKVCQFDVFGSAEKGKGKACKNNYRLLFVPAIHAENGFASCEVYSLSVPAASIKAYRKYHKALERDGITKTWGVAVEISIHPGENGGHALEFEPKGFVSSTLAAKLEEIADKSQEELWQPPKVEEPEEKKPRSRATKAKPRKPKATVRKKRT